MRCMHICYFRNRIQFQMNKVIYEETYGSNGEKYLYTNHNSQPVIMRGRSSKMLDLSSNVVFWLKNVFLPQGYPNSVSEDYLEYQLWDTLQAFCSSITGTLATQAMLKGYGVGDKTATASAATITWMLKDGAGMLGRILFAWMKGTQLDCDAKRWRLVADVLNDCAIMLDLLAPIYKDFFLYIVCVSSVTRAIVGVAGGATRAALTLHQARRDNMADVSAKDGSQETLVNLAALLVGFVITPLVAEKTSLVWFLFFVFTFFHLFCNYRAVSAVVMETINLPRLYILIEHYINRNSILSTKQVSKLDPVLRRPGYTIPIHVGCQLRDVLASEEYLDYGMFILGYSTNRITIALSNQSTNRDTMKGCFLAVLVDLLASGKVNVEKNKFLKDTSTTIKRSLQPLDDMFPGFYQSLSFVGWDVNICHLALNEWRFELRNEKAL